MGPWYTNSKSKIHCGVGSGDVGATHLGNETSVAEEETDAEGADHDVVGGSFTLVLKD